MIAASRLLLDISTRQPGPPIWRLTRKRGEGQRGGSGRPAFRIIYTTSTIWRARCSKSREPRQCPHIMGTLHPSPRGILHYGTLRNDTPPLNPAAGSTIQKYLYTAYGGITASWHRGSRDGPASRFQQDVLNPATSGPSNSESHQMPARATVARVSELCRKLRIVANREFVGSSVSVRRRRQSSGARRFAAPTGHIQPRGLGIPRDALLEKERKGKGQEQGDPRSESCIRKLPEVRYVAIWRVQRPKPRKTSDMRYDTILYTKILRLKTPPRALQYGKKIQREAHRSCACIAARAMDPLRRPDYLRLFPPSFSSFRFRQPSFSFSPARQPSFFPTLPIPVEIGGGEARNPVA